MEDKPGDRILFEGFKDISDAPTLEKCLDYCKNFKYTGFEAKGICYCGNQLKRTILVPDSDPCDTSTRLNVYTIESPEPFNGQCLKDTQGDRILNVWKQFLGTLTVEICLDYCKNFKYAGVSAKHYCFCGNELSETVLLPDSDCDWKCDGDLTQNCGGAQNTNVYAIAAPQKFNGQCMQDSELNKQGVAERVVGDAVKHFQGIMTIEMCLDFCKDYKYAAVEFAHECYCGNKINKMTLLPDSDCDTKCAGDQTQTCGSSSKLNLYTVDIQKPLRSSFKK